MSDTATALKARAQKQRRQLARKRRDPRFLRTMGTLVAAKLITTNIEGVEPPKGTVELKDALWAGQIEPRIFELLPAIVLKRPALFAGTEELPDDLHEVVRAIRRGQAEEPFRGVPAHDYLPWVRRIGHKNKAPTLLKSFRLTQEDLSLLRELRDRLVTTEVDVIRRALRRLAQSK